MEETYIPAQTSYFDLLSASHFHYLFIDVELDTVSSVK